MLGLVTDPFVKLTLVGGGHTLQTEQTSVIHKTRNPYWNTEFLFDSTYIEARHESSALLDLLDIHSFVWCSTNTVSDYSDLCEYFCIAFFSFWCTGRPSSSESVRRGRPLVHRMGTNEGVR